MMENSTQSNKYVRPDGSKPTPPDATPVTWEAVMLEIAPELRALILKAGTRYAHSHYGSDPMLLGVERHANDFIVECCQFMMNTLPGDYSDIVLSVHQIDDAHITDWYNVLNGVKRQ